MSLDLPTRPAPFRSVVLVLVGLAAGAGGAALVLHHHEAAPPAGGHAPQAAAKKQMFQCPMHPQILQDHPGSCPICGMELVPIEETGAPAPGRGRILFYRSPMDPRQTSPTPRKDEMGMDFVPVYEGDLQGEGSDVKGLAPVTIDTARQQLIGLRTAKAVLGPVGGDLRTLARLAPDETRIRKVNVKVEGFVEKLYADFVGQPVAKGQPLFSLYSPDFVSAQREYLLAVKTQKALAGGSLQQSGGELLEAAKRRLLLWDMPPQALARLEQTGEVQKDVTLRSPISGVITAKTVVEGARLAPGDMPLEITDLGHLWALADLYEAELSRVKVGQAADLTIQAFPGRTFHARVAFVDPVLDPKTRTAKVRLVVANPKGELKPDMFGDAVVHAGLRRGLTVPLDAVLDSGTRKVVFLALGDGKFVPRVVETGGSEGDRVEIRSGLSEGDEVVSGAAFLVDSESRLRSALAQMGSGKDAPASGPKQ
jgi:Cu(I)/Ag(I) efflux system membrane fusion protein